MVKRHKPRRGSLAYSPRKRAKRIIPKIKSVPQEETVRIQAFVGYKAGMTHVFMIDDIPESPTEGLEIKVPVTVLEAPPIKVVAVRAYVKTIKGLKVFSECWSGVDDDLRRKLTIPKEFNHEIKIIEDHLEEIHDIRAILQTKPRLANVPKKKPELIESPISGSNTEEKFEYIKKLLGKDIEIKEVFRPGELVDTISVTKGKGFQGPVKRWGVKIQPAKTARSSKGRHVGTLGPWTPKRTSWRVPLAGQTGYHRRTEFNKRLLKIGENKISLTGGFPHYGIIKSQYILLEGSVPGPQKRPVVLRPAIRAPKRKPKGEPNITLVHNLEEFK
ncbi:MAG: 50S ribosomal protein L3 [Candidatus Hydrothermarchaeota archaeon]